MASPLSPTSRSRENIHSIRSTVQHSFETEFHETVHQEETFYDVEEYVPSSPFMAEPESSKTQRHIPSKPRSPHKMNPEYSSPTKTPSHIRSAQLEGGELSSPFDNKENQPSGGIASLQSSVGFDPDDTCASAFSMVPTADMTRFARLGESPSKAAPSQLSNMTDRPMSPQRNKGNGTITPNRHTRTPGTVTRPLSEASPTPRRQRADESTTQLLDFTEQLGFQGLRHSPKKPILASTPQNREGANLLDFDLPPAPTPRSVPSISVREVESMKANFQSQVSSLKATINGKDATIQSLIEAKNEAERRVGEVSESLQEASDAKKILLEEKEDWERRDNEIKSILRDVKSELVHREKERDELSVRLDENEKKREEGEARIREADAKIAGLESDLQSTSHGDNSVPEGSKPPNKAIEVAVEKVARELHHLYKQKHETKVTALKKSYEGRWEKKIRELDARIDDLTKENEELKNGREATMTKVMPGMVPKMETVDVGTSPRRESEVAPVNDGSAAAPAEFDKTDAEATEQIQTLSTRVASLEEEMQRSKDENGRLQVELESSRAENSDLVAVVEEMLQLDPSSTSTSSCANEAAMSVSEEEIKPHTTALHNRSGSQSDQFHTSSSEHAGANRPPSRSGVAAPKVSGLARPGFGFGGAGRGLGRPTSGGIRSGIMSSIERMGRGRTGDGQ